MGRHRLGAAAVAVLVMVGVGAPAAGDVGFESDSVPSGEWSTITLRVAAPATGSETETHNVRVTLQVDDAFVPGWCASPAGWNCSLTEVTGDPPFYTWEREAGPFEAEDAFRFALRAPVEEGEYRFPLGRLDSGGTDTHWDDSHPDRPAPRLRVTAET